MAKLLDRWRNPIERKVLTTEVAAPTLVPLGLRVEESEVRDRFGFSDPGPGARIFGQAAPPPGAGEPPTIPDAIINSDNSRRLCC